MAAWRRSLCAGLFVLSSLYVAAPSFAHVWPDVIAKAEQGLAHSDVERRRRAANQLVSELPPSAVRRLLPRALADADPAVRISAGRAAIRVGFTEARSVVLTWLADPDAGVRRIGARVLGEFFEPASTLALARGLSDPDASVRIAVARALGRAHTSEAVSVLVGRLDDSDPLVVLAVIEALETLGDAQASLALTSRLQDSRLGTRSAAARALGVLGGDAAVAALALALRDPEARARVAVARALGRTQSPNAVEPLARVASDEAESVEPRVAALMALSELAHSQPARVESVRALIGALGSLRQEVRDEARLGLLSAAPDCASDAECLEALRVGATQSGADPVSREAADACVEALGATSAELAYGIISRALQGGSVTQNGALRAYAQLADARALPQVLEALDAPRPHQRALAREAALRILRAGEPDGRAVDPIEQALQRADLALEERLGLIELLGATRAARGESGLLRLAAAPTQLAVRSAALRALAELGQSTPAIEQVLLAGLADEQTRVRLESARAVRRAGGPRLVAPLLVRLEKAQSLDRQALALALAGPLSRTGAAALATGRAVDRLERLIGNARPALAHALISALAHVPTEEGNRALLTLNRGRPALRAKLSEALAIHWAARAKVAGAGARQAPAATSAFEALLSNTHADEPATRANAVWALDTLMGAGFTMSKRLPALARDWLRDLDVRVAGNAAALLARREPSEADRGKSLQALCSALTDSRVYVRANAAFALASRQHSCGGEPFVQLLVRDSSALVRQRAALVLRASRADDARVLAQLRRCASQDLDERVARTCSGLKTRSRSGLSSEAQHTATTLFVSSLEEPGAQPGAEFALRLPTGALRLGFADQQGAVEQPSPAAGLALEIPAELTR